MCGVLFLLTLINVHLIFVYVYFVCVWLDFVDLTCEKVYIREEF